MPPMNLSNIAQTGSKVHPRTARTQCGSGDVHVVLAHAHLTASSSTPHATLDMTFQNIVHTGYFFHHSDLCSEAGALCCTHDMRGL